MDFDLSLGALPNWIVARRQNRLDEKVKRVTSCAGVADLSLGALEAVLLLRSGWMAPWLEQRERQVVKDHLAAKTCGGAPCTGEHCPLCLTESEHAGVHSARAQSIGVDVFSAKLLTHLVDAAADQGYPRRDLRLASKEAAMSAQARLMDALDILEACVPLWPALRTDAAQRIVLFESDNLFGLTSPLVPMTIFVNASCEVPEMIERLVHEATHGQVYNIQDAVRVTSAPRDHLITSPLRDDPRPVPGVLHATVVCARVALASVHVASTLNGSVGSRMGELGERAAESALEGCDELVERGLLTEEGDALVRAAQRSVDHAGV